MLVAAAVWAAIPSPGSGDIHIGPLRFTAYGLMIALGVLAAVELARRRAASRSINPEDITAVATWAVPAGLVGARLYHVITDYRRFEGHWLDVFKIWEGGLGIPGGVIAGVLVGLWVAHRRGLVLFDAMDVVAPALPLAQAVGRWGNWWNQELFGRPTDLPWALEIDARHRPAGYETSTTFHPTFLYESLWNLALVAVLLRIDKTRRLRPGQLFFLYVLGYGVGRLWVEALRIDAASMIGPFRVNTWVSMAAIAGGLIGFVWAGRRGAPRSSLVGLDDGAVVAVDDDLDGADAVVVVPSAGSGSGEGVPPAGSGPGVLGEDGVGEGGPELDGPGAEVEVGEDDAGQADDGIDPDEGAGSAEVPERSR